jgi:hypothetical protein
MISLILCQDGATEPWPEGPWRKPLFCAVESVFICVHLRFSSARIRLICGLHRGPNRKKTAELAPNRTKSHQIAPKKIFKWQKRATSPRFYLTAGGFGAINPGNFLKRR